MKKDNLNIIQQNNFKIDIVSMPYLSMFAQTVGIPSISLGSSIQPTPLLDVNIPGDTMTFDNLDLTFMVDEHLLNYKEIWNWMTHLGFPRSTEEYKRLIQGDTQYTKVSDIHIWLTTNKYNTNIKVTFVDAFPVMLSELLFDTTITDIDALSASCSFMYSYYYFTPE